MVIEGKMRTLHASRCDALTESRGLDQIRKALFATKGSVIGVNTAKSESNKQNIEIEAKNGWDGCEREGEHFTYIER